jgi:hypothetical protein
MQSPTAVSACDSSKNTDVTVVRVKNVHQRNTKQHAPRLSNQQESNTITEDTAVALASPAIEPSPLVVGSALKATPIREAKRVGPVRIGSVMMSLLKKYGITDQEITEVLSSIAQENCQIRAG